MIYYYTEVKIKVERLQAVVYSNNDTILFQWQPFTVDNITKLALMGYLLQCNDILHGNTWQYTIWDPQLSIAIVQTQQFLINRQYSCSITAFNPVGFGIHSDAVQLQINGEH